jgi:Fic/DOC family
MPDLDHLLLSIKRSRSGVSLTDLLLRNPSWSRRTAQRGVAVLIEKGQVSAIGSGPSRRYAAAAPALEAKPSSGPDNFPASIPLSDESIEILKYVDQSLVARKPVGYQSEFLSSYRPNKVWYLPESARRHLHRLGRTDSANSPAGTYSRAILSRLLIDLSWASSQLEGNTYSRLDTRLLIERGKAAKGKAAIETQMILNHKAAIELLVENIDTAKFNRYTLLNLHSALSENLLPNAADEGRLRRHAVDFSKSVYRPLSVPAQIDEEFNAFLIKAEQIADPFEQSFFVMVHLPYLQPFADMNKRTSRLAANLPLFRANLCPLTFLDVPERAYSRAMLGLYETTRIELLRDLFVWAYERSTQEYLAIRQGLAEPDPTRLAWRDLIKKVIHRIVVNPPRDPNTLVRRLVGEAVPKDQAKAVEALIMDELGRLHEGVLARYALKPSEFARWQAQQPKRSNR